MRNKKNERRHGRISQYVGRNLAGAMSHYRETRHFSFGSQSCSVGVVVFAAPNTRRKGGRPIRYSPRLLTRRPSETGLHARASVALSRPGSSESFETFPTAPSRSRGPRRHTPGSPPHSGGDVAASLASARVATKRSGGGGYLRGAVQLVLAELHVRRELRLLRLGGGERLVQAGELVHHLLQLVLLHLQRRHHHLRAVHHAKTVPGNLSETASKRSAKSRKRDGLGG
eukprot:676474-Prorocentrum_minimum.AAC.7